MKAIYYFITINLAFLLFSCSEYRLEPTNTSMGKPKPIESGSITISSIPGGVVIKYQVPNVEDMLEIKAVYTLSNGKKREESASFYHGQLTLKGYNDTNEHEALLYTINRAMELSEPVSVKFTPLESSLSKTAKTVQISATYGGANFSWKNNDKELLSFEFLTEDKTGSLQSARIIESNQDSTSYVLYGYPAQPRQFAVVIRDIYNNESDVIYPEGLITPYPDAKLNKKDMRIVILPGVNGAKGDASFNYWGNLNEFLLDDDIYNFGHTDDNVMPNASVTLDLGHYSRLSRIVIHQRQDVATMPYARGNPKTFSVYGTASSSPSGDWSEWTKITDCSVVKPSGLPLGQTSNDDIIAMNAGHEFFFPIGGDVVRFIRFQFHETWANQSSLHFAEITCYGESVE
jgi:hypothetical protein